MPHLVDLTGKLFGRLTVVRQTEHIGKNPAWLCECSCGERTTVAGYHLRAGTTLSCGCLGRERVTTHGYAANGCKSKLYRAWNAIKARCNDLDNPYYGGRGIAVCQRWLESFEAFRDDMGEPPTPEHSIERLDFDGPYSPENCVWATWTEQANNTRKNLLVDFNGRTQTLSQWSRELGFDYQPVYRQLRKGLDFERALEYARNQRYEPSQN